MPVNPNSLSQEQRKALPSVMLVLDKYAPDGTFVKKKARFVVKGFMEIWNDKATSPTVTHEVIMLGLNAAASLNYDIDIFDVKAAFLEADLNRNVLVQIDGSLAKYLIERQPALNLGLLPTGALIVKLKKALYGLRDAPKLWYEKLRSVLISIGFSCSPNDNGLFVRKTNQGTHYVLVHVDDILSTGPPQSMNELRKGLVSAFKEVKQQRNPEEFNYLGMLLRRDRARRTISINQRGYIEDIIDRLQIHGASTLPHNEDILGEDQSPLLSEELKSTFISVTMSMMYVARTRLDILRTLSYLTTRLVAPTQKDWAKMVKVGEYLNGTKDMAVVVRASNMVLCGASDASFAVHKDRKSHTGGVLWLGDHNYPIHASSKKQTLVTTSSTESELVAAGAVAKNLVWIRKILHEMGLDQKDPTALHQDNRACIILANRGSSKLSRSVDIKYFWLSEKIEEGVIALLKVRTDENVADGLTKPLFGEAFLKWRAMVLNLE